MKGTGFLVVCGSAAVGLSNEGDVQGKKMHVLAPTRHDRVPHLRSGTSLSKLPSDHNFY
jgi:hypothetical protein